MNSTFHLVARVHRPLRPFEKRELCVDLWLRLTKSFENCLACVLMPNHLHLILEAKRPELARHRLQVALRSFTRHHFPGRALWETVPTPAPIPDEHHLKRQLRYVHLNPCRSGLSKDPLDWEWSTHRDASGLVHEEWVDRTRLAKLLKITPRDFPKAFHAYVSSDPSVHPSGTAFPVFGPEAVMASPEAIRSAVLLTLRAQAGDLARRTPARRVMVRLMAELTGARSGKLASTLDVSERSARWILAQPATPTEVAAAVTAKRLLCDPRLLKVRGELLPPTGSRCR